MWDSRILKDPYSGKFINHIKMANKLELIRKKVESIRYGLLRFSEGALRRSMEVQALPGNEFALNCVIKDDKFQASLLNREVNLVQKKDDDYLYISGKVDDEVRSQGKTIRLKIIKAFWFTRKKKGSAVWLQEKFTYEQDDMEKAS
jgi:hypothetical protein